MTARLPPAYRLVALDRVDSTNDEAKRRARAGAEDGTLVWALSQERGRGRHGRKWESPPGNLYCSLVLRPEIPVAEAACLSFIAAVAVGDTVGGLAPSLVEVKYKWPNDVLLNGGKVAGILLESSAAPDGNVDCVVLGVGINVASAPRGTDFPATSLAGERADPVTIETVLETFARHFLAWADRWLDEGFAPVRQHWLSHAWALGEDVEMRTGDRALTGRFDTLDPSGAMILVDAAGKRHTIASGEVLSTRAAARARA